MKWYFNYFFFKKTWLFRLLCRENCSQMGRSKKRGGNLTAVYSRIREVLEMGDWECILGLWLSGRAHTLWKALPSIPITLQREEAVTQRNHVQKVSKQTWETLRLKQLSGEVMGLKSLVKQNKKQKQAIPVLGRWDEGTVPDQSNRPDPVSKTDREDGGIMHPARS